jgi:hypothetical protein
VIGTSAKNGDGIDKVFQDMLSRMNKGKAEFFNQNKRERGATISLNKGNVKTGATTDKGAKGAKANGGAKKKKCC